MIHLLLLQMSKSLGNVVDPMALKNKYGGQADILRYYLLREGVPHNDGSRSSIN
jgi:methionyl-tRNA synthetase